MRFWGVDPGRKSPGWHGDFSPGFSDLELVSRQRFFKAKNAECRHSPQVVSGKCNVELWYIYLCLFSW